MQSSQPSSPDYGSIEGRLSVVSERGKLHVVVYEPIWDKPIRCNLTEEQADEATEYFQKRVAVYGEIKYRQDGTPISVAVDHIDLFPAPDELPGPADVYGILRNYR